jgi:hypothetical protein
MINNQQDVPIDEMRILTSRFDFVIYKFKIIWDLISFLITPSLCFEADDDYILDEDIYSRLTSLLQTDTITVTNKIHELFEQRFYISLWKKVKKKVCSFLIKML